MSRTNDETVGANSTCWAVAPATKAPLWPAHAGSPARWGPRERLWTLSVCCSCNCNVGRVAASRSEPPQRRPVRRSSQRAVPPAHTHLLPTGGRPSLWTDRQTDRQGYYWAYIRTDLEHQNSALAVYTLLEDLLASIVEWACTPPSATAETRALTAPYGDGGYKAVDSDR